MFHTGSRSLLGWRERERFSGDTLFAKLARVVCDADCLPRKELFEAWELARRVRRRLRGGRVVNLACGHGLLAFILMLLDSTSGEALAVDTRIPASAAQLRTALAVAWPDVVRRITLVEGQLESIPLATTDVVVSAHACGALTDVVVDRAIQVGARVGVLPCCHVLDGQSPTGLEGWLDGPLAQDVARATRLQRAGYRVHTQTIPIDITPRNRVLLAWPRN